MRSTPQPRRFAAVALAAGLALLGLPGSGSAAPQTGGGTQPAAAGPAAVRPPCGTVMRPGEAACLTLVSTDSVEAPSGRVGAQAAPPAGAGYGPASLQGAYALPSASAGAGQTVAIVDAYDYPKAEEDLAAYREAWGLPACTTANGCFHKVNQRGQASPLPPEAGTSGWATEMALDLDMVSAICPNCSILLVEADSNTVTDLGEAVNSAVRLGAGFVSNSYGADEYDGETADEAAYFDHPGVVVTASSGDWGYGMLFPASSPHVVSVGGTSLVQDGSGRGWSETVWDGAGSGCSAYEAKPGWQEDTGCLHRTSADVSAVADPATGVAVYDTYDQTGWLKVGGTSASAPIIAATYALVGRPAEGTYPASYLYAHTDQLNDVTSGSNGNCDPAYLCTAGPGFDGPTGWGTPNGVGAFGVPSGNLITVTNPGDQQATQDMAFCLQIRAVDTAPGETLTFAATGLPAGLSIDPATGLVSGTPSTEVGEYPVTVTATDSTGATGAAKFVVSVVSPVGIGALYAQSAYVGQPVLVPVEASDAVPGRVLDFSASGLPAGVSIDRSTGLITGTPTVREYAQVTVTVRDSAGRSAQGSFIWYTAPAQVDGASGPVRLGSRCLDGGGDRVGLSTCDGQEWTLGTDGTLRTGDRCLTADGGSGVGLADCDAGSTQQWRVASFGELVNPASGACLTAGGTGVGTAACTGATGQRWSVPAGAALSGVTGLCADSGARTTGHLQVWYCANSAAQAWTVRTDGTVGVGKSCLATTGAEGAGVSLARCDRSAGQQWRVQPDGTVVHAASGRCLADPGDSLVGGTGLVVQTCRTTWGQLWHLL